MNEAAVKNEKELAAGKNDLAKELDKIASGRMTLMVPLTAAGREITELNWDFRKLTGWDYVNALDCDNAGVNVFKITNKQALSLFAAAAAKATTMKNEAGIEIHPLDAHDIRDRLGIDDTIKAVQTATVFFVASARVGNKRISDV